MTKPTVVPVDVAGVPADLRALPRWVNWRYVERAKPDGSKVWAKMPLQPSGRAATSTDPKTWTTFDDAVDALIMGDANGRAFDGVGLVLGDEVQGIDLDDHRDPQTGQLSPLAQELIERVDGYAEVSPSGTGIKLFTRHNAPAAVSHELGVEVYRSGRYFTVTGQQVNGHSCLPADVQDVGWLVERVRGPGADLTVSLPASTGDAAADALLNYRAPVDGWDLERVTAELLPHLDADAGYSDWLRVGQALHHQGQGDDDWLQAWDEWSQGSGKYVVGECAAKWDSFGRRSGPSVTLATLLAQTKDQRKAQVVDTQATGFFRSVGELVSDRRPTSWLLKGYIAQSSIALLFGPSGEGKTFVAIGMALSVASGNPWAGCGVSKCGVAYLNAEGSAGVAKRCAAWGQHHDVDLTTVPMFVSAAPVSLIEEDSCRVAAAAVQEIVDRSGPVGLVVIDTFNRIGGGDENSNSDVARILKNLETFFVKRFNAAVLIVHHPGHGDSSRSRGAYALPAGVDSSFVLKGGELRNLKQKDSELIAPLYLSRQVVELSGWAPDPDTGEVPTSLVLVPQREPVQKSAEQLDRENLRQLLRLIDEAAARGGHVSASATSTRSAFKVLREAPGFPHRIQRASEVERLLKIAQDEGWITDIEVPDSNRKLRARVAVTGPGRAFYSDFEPGARSDNFSTTT